MVVMVVLVEVRYCKRGRDRVMKVSDTCFWEWSLLVRDGDGATGHNRTPQMRMSYTQTRFLELKPFPFEIADQHCDFEA